jgi:hypothetical protein
VSTIAEKACRLGLCRTGVVDSGLGCVRAMEVVDGRGAYIYVFLGGIPGCRNVVAMQA